MRPMHDLEPVIRNLGYLKRGIGAARTGVRVAADSPESSKTFKWFSMFNMP